MARVRCSARVLVGQQVIVERIGVPDFGLAVFGLEFIAQARRSIVDR